MDVARLVARHKDAHGSQLVARAIDLGPHRLPARHRYRDPRVVAALTHAAYDLVCPNGHRTHCRCEWSQREIGVQTARNLIAVCGLMCRECEELIERVEEVPSA